MMPFFESSWGNGVPSKVAVRMVSSKRITPPNGLLDALGRKEHIAIGAAIVVIGFDLDAVETPLDRPHTLVGRENTFSFCHHRLSNLFKFLFGHDLIPPFKR